MILKSLVLLFSERRIFVGVQLSDFQRISVAVESCLCGVTVLVESYRVFVDLKEGGLPTF